MVLGDALSIEATLGLFTHILTLGYVVLLPTEGIYRAVVIHQTVNRRLAPLRVGVTHSARWTQTLVAASEVVAACASTTWLIRTEIDGLASLEGVSLEAIATEAYGLVTLGDTEGILPALIVDATSS